MSIIEIKKELHAFIDESDEKSIHDFYELSIKYLNQKKEDILMAEAENDIKEGRTYSVDEVKDMISEWTR